jgi:hypothetical protein
VLDRDGCRDVHLSHYFYFGTSKASTSLSGVSICTFCTSKASKLVVRPSEMLRGRRGSDIEVMASMNILARATPPASGDTIATHLRSCQYSYFCTSKASKLSSKRAPRRRHPATYADVCDSVNIALHLSVAN